MIGQTVAHFRILQQIGAGGMGIVYLAEDTRLKRRVALKFLPKGLSLHPPSLERFKRAPIELAVVVDEYGGLEGIVTRTDLLEAITGDLPEQPGEEPEAARNDPKLGPVGPVPAGATGGAGLGAPGT